MLYTVIGAAAFVGLGVIDVSMALSLDIASVISTAFKDITKRKDTRMKSLKEIFGVI